MNIEPYFLSPQAISQIDLRKTETNKDSLVQTFGESFN